MPDTYKCQITKHPIKYPEGHPARYWRRHPDRLAKALAKMEAKSSSYIGTEQSDEPVSRLLWAIREKLGASFTDSLVSNMLLNMVDRPNDGFRTDIHESLKNLLWNADSTFENDHQHWPEIQNVLSHNTFTVTVTQR